MLELLLLSLCLPRYTDTACSKAGEAYYKQIHAEEYVQRYSDKFVRENKEVAFTLGLAYVYRERKIHMAVISGLIVDITYQGEAHIGYSYGF